MKATTRFFLLLLICFLFVPGCGKKAATVEGFAAARGKVLAYLRENYGIEIPSKYYNWTVASAGEKTGEPAEYRYAGAGWTFAVRRIGVGRYNVEADKKSIGLEWKGVVRGYNAEEYYVSYPALKDAVEPGIYQTVQAVVRYINLYNGQKAPLSGYQAARIRDEVSGSYLYVFTSGVWKINIDNSLNKWGGDVCEAAVTGRKNDFRWQGYVNGKGVFWKTGYSEDRRVVMEKFCNAGQGRPKESFSPEEIVVMLDKMLPGQDFRFFEGSYLDKEGRIFEVENILAGSYVDKGKKELLLVARRPLRQLTHEEGFYQAYLAVFNETGRRLKSGVLVLTADEGNLVFYEGSGLSFPFFYGSTVSSGIAHYQPSAWKAGVQWSLLWPDNPNKDFPPMDITPQGLMVYKKGEGPFVPLPTGAKRQYAYKLRWDREKTTFIRVE
ncbi:MAG: hypothetical protein ACM3WV_01990 [Bacillota bacterium]